MYLLLLVLLSRPRQGTQFCNTFQIKDQERKLAKNEERINHLQNHLALVAKESIGPLKPDRRQPNGLANQEELLTDLKKAVNQQVTPTRANLVAGLPKEPSYNMKLSNDDIGDSVTQSIADLEIEGAG